MATPVPGQDNSNGSGSAPATTSVPVPHMTTSVPIASMSSNNTPSLSHSMSTMVFEGPGQSSKAVKRPRPVKSCNSCRQRKLRCDRTCPCSQCQKSNRVCKYANEQDGMSETSDVEASPRPAKRPHRPQQLPYLDSTPSGSVSGATTHMPSVAIGTGGSNEQQQPQQHLPGSGPSSVLEHFGTRLDRLERLILSKSSAGAEPESGHSGSSRMTHAAYAAVAAVTGSPTTIRGLSVKGNLRTRFFGQNSTRVLLNLFDEARDFIFHRSRGEDFKDYFVQLHKIYKALTEENRKSHTPITVFIDSMLPVQKRMADILPNKAICDRLLEAYIAMSEGLYRIVHVPSFRNEYESYWQKTGASDGFLPRLLCMLSIGARFETDTRGLSHDRADGVHVPTACCLVRAWLDSLRGKQLVDVHTLQCEILLLHANRMISSRGQESWMQLGLIVRMAMTMGLHRDPSEFPQIRPFFAELRRRIWYTIMDMDLHVALGTNLPCGVREGEYTCRPPSNLDDNDIYPDMTELPPSKPIDQYTNTQLQAYASRTLPHRIRVSSIINRLDTIRGFQEVLDCGIQLERLLDDINCLFPRNQTLDPRAKFKEWRMRALLDMHVRRPLLALYRPFALSTNECPAHITTSYLKSSMTMLTYLDELDPRMPGFNDVSHMYHIVLKHDIMQAAFSVCYFIKTSNEPSTNTMGSSNTDTSSMNGQLPSPDSNGLGFINALDNRTVWSTQGMTRAVQKTLDSFVAMIKDSSCDLKDTLVLAVVLNSIQAGTSEERIMRITKGIVHIIEASMQALNMSAEGVASIPIHSGPNTPMDPYAPQPSQFSPTSFFDDFSFWDMDQWDLLSVPMGLA